MLHSKTLHERLKLTRSFPNTTPQISIHNIIENYERSEDSPYEGMSKDDIIEGIVDSDMTSKVTKAGINNCLKKMIDDSTLAWGKNFNHYQMDPGAAHKGPFATSSEGHCDTMRCVYRRVDRPELYKDDSEEPSPRKVATPKKAQSSPSSKKPASAKKSSAKSPAKSANKSVKSVTPKASPKGRTDDDAYGYSKTYTKTPSNAARAEGKGKGKSQSKKAATKSPKKKPAAKSSKKKADDAEEVAHDSSTDDEEEDAHTRGSSMASGENNDEDGMEMLLAIETA